jgi:molybdopterin-guanine dinucleotide biosynthesis protein A
MIGITTKVWPDAAGFVLAGGRSSRMGADKALVRFAGRPLVETALEVLRQAGLEAFIAGSRSSLAAFAPVVEDKQAGLGPLGGITAALASTARRWAIFLPVDLPLLPASLLRYMLHHAQITGRAVTVPSVTGFVQSFPAVVDRAALPFLRSELEAGRGGCFAGFQAACAALGEPVSVLPVELLAQCGQVSPPDALPPALWFLNVNSPVDLQRAEARRPAQIA